MHEDFDRCYRAVQSKDARFDGWFVTAVLTTRIYCRPSCPARSPFAKNVRFYPTAAAAQHAGFRACKRCRPDASPGSPEWNVRSDVVARAMRLVADGVVDRDGVAGLASRLGYSPRQLQRVLLAEVGAGPLALARAQRAQAARVLIETTTMPFSDVAFGSGFASIRQFNDTVRMIFAQTPTELRARAADRSATTDRGAGGSLVFRLPFRRPFRPDGLFGHLAATAVPGCEEVAGTTYRRTLGLAHGDAVVALTPTPDHVHCRLRIDDLRDLPTAISRCRRLLDLDADPEAIRDFLLVDPTLGDLVAEAGGRRIPRTVDGEELAVRVLIGQQVSTAAARTHLARLVARHGRAIADPEGSLTHVFPSTRELAHLDPASLALPESRRASLTALVAAIDDGSVDVGPGADWARARATLATLPGVGPWTCEMIAMRGLGDPDAFPASDHGVRTAATRLGLPSTAARLGHHAGRWRPWRSYAVQYLWSTVDHATNHWPSEERHATPHPSHG